MSNLKHGHTRRVKGRVVRSATYISWESMNSRCYRESHPRYHYYGGRGIEVCIEWRSRTKGAFINFLRYMGERPSKEMTLDRIKVNGNYEPGNVRWADKKVQANNTQARCVPVVDDDWIEL